MEKESNKMEQSLTKLKKGMRLSTLIYLLLIAKLGHCQQYDLATDEETFEQFLDKDWKKLNQSAQESFAKDIDFYYLRLRNGIALDNLNKPNLAASNYQKAHRYFPEDTLSQYYSYFSLLNAGRLAEARVLSKDFTKSQLQTSGYRNIYLHSVSLDGGALIESGSKVLIPQTITEVTVDQRQQKNLYFTNLSATLVLGKRLMLSAAYGFMDINNEVDFSFKRPKGDKIDTITRSFSTKQHSFFGGLNVQLNSGWSVAASGSVLTYKGETTYIGDTLLKPPFRLDTIPFSASDYSLSFFLTKRWSSVAASGGFAYNNTSDSALVQGVVNLTYFPLGNSNLYISATVNTLVRDITWVVAGGKVGGKLAKWLWAEGHFAAGKMKGMSEAGSLIVNNNPDQILWKAGANLTLVLGKRIEIPIRFAILGRQGQATTNGKDDGVFSSKQIFYTYSHILINTGIKLYF